MIFDEWAYNNTIENAHCNGINNLEVKLGGAELLSKEKFDLLFANIQRNILLNDLQYYTAAMKQKAELIMSGFYLEDLPSIQQKTDELGLKFCTYREMNNWVAAKFMRE